MNTHVSLIGAVVIGAMAPPRSRAPFESANLLLRAADGTMLDVSGYATESRAHGTLLTPDEVAALVAAGHAVEFSAAIPAVEGATLWILRANMRRRDQALSEIGASGVLMSAVLIGPDDARWCLVVESHPEAGQLRDHWQEQAIRAAREHIGAGRWTLAEAEAETAESVGRGLLPHVLALLAFVYENHGREQRARGLMAMARRGRGEAFAEEMAAALDALRASAVAGAGDGADRSDEAARPARLDVLRGVLDRRRAPRSFIPFAARLAA